MRLKNSILSVGFIAVTMMFAAFDWFRFDLVKKTNSLVIGNLVCVVYIVYGLMGICSVIYAVRMIKTLRWRAFILTVVFLIAIAYIFWFPLTDLYLRMNYTHNLNKREEIVNMFTENQLLKYKIGQDEYMVPYRFSSHTGTIFTQERNGVTKIMFCVYRGLGITRVLIYVSDDSGINEDDFNFNIPKLKQRYNNIKKMNANWYFANINS